MSTTRLLTVIFTGAFLAGCRGPNPAFDDPVVIDAAADGHGSGGGSSGGSTAGGGSAGGGGAGPEDGAAGSGGAGPEGGAGGDGGGAAGGGGIGGAGTGGDGGSVDTGITPDLVPASPPDAAVDSPPPTPDGSAADVAPSMDIAGDGVIPHGLRADYFDDTTLTKRAYTQIDPTLEFAWGKVAPDPRLNFAHGWSVRWTGKLKPRFSEQYQLIAHAGDGVRVSIDGTEVIKDWEPHEDRDAITSIMLSNTRTYDIKVEYNFISGWAVVRLGWSSLNQPREIIPTEAYTPSP